MSPELERIIGKAVMDKAFRDELIENPEDAIQKAGIKLEDGDLKQLKQNIRQAKNTLASQQLDQTFSTARGAWWA